jgi:hypothetical protein
MIEKQVDDYWRPIKEANDEHDRITDGIVGNEFYCFKGPNEGETYKVTEAPFHPYIGGYVYLENTRTKEKHHLRSRLFRKYLCKAK